MLKENAKTLSQLPVRWWQQELGLCHHCHGQKQHRSQSYNVSRNDGSTTLENCKISITSLQQGTARSPSWNNQRLTPHSMKSQGHVPQSQLFIDCKTAFVHLIRVDIIGDTSNSERFPAVRAQTIFPSGCEQLVLTWCERSCSLTGRMSKLYYMTGNPQVAVC